MTNAVFAGSFDPPTNGHLDIIERAAALCDKLDVVISVNPEKKYMFSEKERLEMMEQLIEKGNEFIRLVPRFGITDDVKEIYKQRPQHIERVFADGKMKYGLTKTYFRTREKVQRELTLLYACMNLKKFALHHYA